MPYMYVTVTKTPPIACDCSIPLGSAKNYNIKEGVSGKKTEKGKTNISAGSL